ncbi:TetR/AcrR family transcriptional regulator [Actinacidiphila epipremni]|uniref:TetR/AcrR family transcriptional regulator n=1 Tax=Actinacidiphila epipremni TaxID=2053013 RepID=A0ABX0ZPJ8_9ACTN|nr:TetR/AcrR family transcriptional regulator [Actinacidiphila epipremni]NJP44576.1 TetR/AcrR family transcriptional regulator [Actinacidiphila epipremni]
MSIQERRERERAEREQLIVSTARELAEAEGWDAVTTRRLAAEIEYSQPVLYSHFKGKGAIMTAVALQGFVELAAVLRAARTGAEGSRAGTGGRRAGAQGPQAEDAGASAGDPRASAEGRAEGPRAALTAVADAYTAFAAERPALYEAMFTRAVDLPFASPEAPAPLWAAFDELLDAVTPHAAPDEDPGILTETFWAALHGLATLGRSGRLPAAAHTTRLALLTAHFAGPPAAR